MGSPRLVTLLTDFGWADPWLAEVKGALFTQWARYPDLDVPPALIDLGHDLPRGDVAAAAWFLNRVRRCWPSGTVHLAVVDPGVGSDRPAVACAAGGSHFVGPGNGLLAFLGDEPDLEVVRLDGPLYRGHPAHGRVSGTFHGRDVFAPAAAHLVAGAPLDQLGSPGAPADLGALSCVPGVTGPRIRWIDRFGNAVTDLGREGVEGAALGGGAALLVGGRSVPGPFPNFAAAAGRGPFWYWGSGDTVEIAVTGASAAELLGLAVGLELRVAAP
ncbi:MAG: S-adenosyl-l-methionine hydroxide adenosyltransferase family protein [Candidatus Krumholzibacteriia bacterium]